MHVAPTPALVLTDAAPLSALAQGTAPTPPAPPSPPSVPQVAVPTAPVAVDASAVPSIDALNAQLVGMRAQLRGLQDQARVVRTELRHAKDAGERGQLMTRYADAQTQAAQLRGDIARVEAELATRQTNEAGQTSTPPTFPPMRSGIDPDYIAGLMFAFIFAVAMPIALAYARRIWKGKPSAAVPQENPATAQRLERMEQAIDSVAIEVERISEAQRFVTKVLVERSQGPSVDAANNGASSLADGAPIRALGAGAPPIETIKKSEKLRV